MNLRFGIAKAIGAASTWGLRSLFHRPAENFPGKAALLADPELIGDLRSRIREGSVIVVGTNGKTTVANLLADAFEQAGKKVACNRTGANLDSGVASALLHAGEVDWGVFESDELWLAKTLPHLQSDYVVLLNLFRDQLDRMGEIDHIQSSIAAALASSPGTTLVYNADDPLCQAIANRVSNPCVPFGIGEDLKLPANTVADAGMCQECDEMLVYDWRLYGQLGSYRCESCGFSRPKPAYCAREVRLSKAGTEFKLETPNGSSYVSTPFASAYMICNAMALFTAAELCEIPLDAIKRALARFDPQNGRLQAYEIDGQSILLNLAKNPTGFNQNLDIVLRDEGPKAVAFYINDKEADGHDVSWLWDVDFQLLAGKGIVAYAGGTRRHDMRVRLKYAGVNAGLVDGAGDFLAKAKAAAAGATREGW